MIRAILILLAFALSWVPDPVSAQKAGAAPPAISAEQARTALEVLSDPAKRAEFAATLSAIVKAQPAAPTGTAALKPATPAAVTGVEGLKIQLPPNSLGAQVLFRASEFVSQMGDRAMDALNAAQSLALLYGWVVVMTTNQTARSLLADTIWRIALVLACAAAVEYGLRWIMRHPIERLEGLAPFVRPVAAGDSPSEPVAPATDDAEDALARAEAGNTEAPALKRSGPTPWILLKRIPLMFSRLLLELVPVIAILLIGHLIAGTSLGGHPESRLIVLAAIDSYALCAALLCVVHMLLSPNASRLRLFQLRDTNAIYLMRWSRRLILIGVIGYAIGEAGLLLGLSDLAHDALDKAVSLVLHICVAIMVVQKRRAVRHWLRAEAEATGPVATVRNRFAGSWHWIALFFLTASWLISAIEVRDGYVVVLHYFIITALVMIGARLALVVLLGVADRILLPAVSETAMLSPGLQTRLRRYHPVVTLALRAMIYLLAILGLLQLYGLNTFLWLIDSNLGQRILSASGSLMLTIVMAFGVWEAINGGFQQYLDRLQREAQLAKSARLRTLLPLLRTTVLIAIAVVAGLMILGEVGINIAPLLAGAGIVGVAIGFGSQKLVQDLITGIFLLLENAMQVGDFVSVSGLSGVVEALSVRTIRLRAGDGSVHIIPFSSVTSVTNSNRGLGNAAVSVSVGYDEDTDRVAGELKEIVAGMRAESDFSARMLSDFQLWGIDKVDGAQATIVGQIVCTDSGRWSVQREFNRRMKRRFQELGIRIYNPAQSVAVTMPVQTPAAKGEDHAHAQAAN